MLKFGVLKPLIISVKVKVPAVVLSSITVSDVVPPNTPASLAGEILTVVLPIAVSVPPVP